MQQQPNADTPTQRHPNATTNPRLQPPGGASSSHTVGSRAAAHRPWPGSTAGETARSGKATPGIAAEWPRAGWGPGSLTVSRPPRAAGASETARSTAAVMAAFAGSTDTVPGGGAARIGESVGVGSGGGSAQRAGEEEGETNGEYPVMGKAGGDDASRVPGGDSIMSASNEKDGLAARPPSDDLVDMRFSGADDVDMREGGFTTDSSVPAEEGAILGHDAAGGGQGGQDGGGPDESSGTPGKEPSQQGEHLKTRRQTVFLSFVARIT